MDSVDFSAPFNEHYSSMSPDSSALISPVPTMGSSRPMSPFIPSVSPTTDMESLLHGVLANSISEQDSPASSDQSIHGNMINLRGASCSPSPSVGKQDVGSASGTSGANLIHDDSLSDLFSANAMSTPSPGVGSGDHIKGTESTEKSPTTPSEDKEPAFIYPVARERGSLPSSGVEPSHLFDSKSSATGPKSVSQQHSSDSSLDEYPSKGQQSMSSSTSTSTPSSLNGNGKSPQSNGELSSGSKDAFGSFNFNAASFTPRSKRSTSSSSDLLSGVSDGGNNGGSSLSFSSESIFMESSSHKPRDFMDGSLDSQSYEPNFQTKERLFRTKVCSYFYYTGKCQKGDHCNFSHEIYPGMEPPPPISQGPSSPRSSYSSSGMYSQSDSSRRDQQMGSMYRHQSSTSSSFSSHDMGHYSRSADSQSSSSSSSGRGSGPQHSQGQQQGYVSVQQLYRTKPCRFFFEKGRCLKGERCNFSHDPIFAEQFRKNASGDSSDPYGSEN